MYTYGTAGAESVFYDVHVYDTAVIPDIPTTKSGVVTLLANSTQYGLIEKDSINAKIEPNDTVEGQGGGSVAEVPRDYNGTVELKDINATESNISGIQNVVKSANANSNVFFTLVLHDPKSKRIQIFRDLKPLITEETGSNASYSIRAKKTVIDPALFRVRFNYSGFPEGT